MRKLVKHSVLGLVAIYLLLTAGMFTFQRSLIYIPRGSVPSPAASSTPEMHIIQLMTEDGLNIRSWYAPPQGSAPTIVLFHGNAGHVGYQGRLVRPLLDRGYGVLLLEYRGYGGNPGTPTEDGLYADARAAIEFLTANGVTTDKLVFYGRSLGTGVAVQMASEYAPGALILQAPYTSLPDVGAARYWFLPVKMLALDQFDSLAKIKGVTAPLFIFYGDQDNVIPPEQGAMLYAAANQPKQQLVITGASHNNVFRRGGTEAVSDFLLGVFGR